jgi:hypothetical protein
MSDNENVFWISVWSLCAATIISLSIVILIASRHNTELYYKAQTECVSSGGSWLPMSNYNATCLKK